MSSLSQLMLSSVEVIKHVSVMLLNIKQMFVKLLQTEIHLFNLIYFSLCFCTHINVYNIFQSSFQLWSSLTHSNMYNSVFLYNSYVEFCQNFWKFCSFLIQSCSEIRKFHSLESLRSTRNGGQILRIKRLLQSTHMLNLKFLNASLLRSSECIMGVWVWHSCFLFPLQTDGPKVSLINCRLSSRLCRRFLVDYQSLEQTRAETLNSSQNKHKRGSDKTFLTSVQICDHSSTFLIKGFIYVVKHLINRTFMFPLQTEN